METKKVEKERTAMQLMIDAIEAIDMSTASVDTISTAHFIKKKAESIQAKEEREMIIECLTSILITCGRFQYREVLEQRDELIEMVKNCIEQIEHTKDRNTHPTLTADLTIEVAQELLNKYGK